MSSTASRSSSSANILISSSLASPIRSLSLLSTTKINPCKLFQVSLLQKVKQLIHRCDQLTFTVLCETEDKNLHIKLSAVSKFLLNNQPDALIIQIYCYRTLHVSGIFSARHQEFSTVHSALVSFMQVLMTASKQSGWNCSAVPSWKRSSKFTWNLPVLNVQWKTPDDGQRRCPKHVEFYNGIKLG